jgi:hypothetical protein
MRPVVSGPQETSSDHENGEPAKRQRPFRTAVLDSDWARFTCECGSESCAERLVVTLAQYALVRDHPRWFLIAPGHEVAGSERVIERHGGYLVVEGPRGTGHR